MHWVVEAGNSHNVDNLVVLVLSQPKDVVDLKTPFALELPSPNELLLRLLSVQSAEQGFYCWQVLLCPRSGEPWHGVFVGVFLEASPMAPKNSDNRTGIVSFYPIAN